MSDTWQTIPFAPNYEMNCSGKLRNKKTGYVLKWRSSKHNAPQVSLSVNGKMVYASRAGLLWLLFGIIPKTCPKPVLISKGARSLRFDSFRQCANFLAPQLFYSAERIMTFLVQRHAQIGDWSVHYLK